MNEVELHINVDATNPQVVQKAKEIRDFVRERRFADPTVDKTTLKIPDSEREIYQKAVKLLIDDGTLLSSSSVFEVK